MVRRTRTSSQDKPVQRLFHCELVNHLSAKTEGHKNYIRAICENDFVIVYGPPGSSKSYTAAGMAAQALSNNDVDSIIITRPLIQTGRSGIGFLKGTLEEKINPYMIPLFEHFEYFLGKRQFQHLIQEEIIKVVPLELARGYNFERAFVIGDEMQNADYEQLKMILTRVCDGTKIILNGDIKQSDLKQCDFQDIIDRLDGLNGFAIVKLTNADIMRHPMVSKILARLENEN